MVKKVAGTKTEYAAVCFGRRLQCYKRNQKMSDYENKIIRKRIRVYGAVQGVGFRYRAEHAAEAVGATGWVQNEPDGSVTMEIQGTEEQIDKAFLMISQGRYVNIEKMDAKSIPLIEDERAFRTRE